MRTLFAVIALVNFFSLNAQKIGGRISGNFGGRNSAAAVIKVKQEAGNPVESGTPAVYGIFFSDKRLGKIQIGCCDAVLVNEGDLNGDGRDELSVFQNPMNGCTASMRTFSFKTGQWKKIVPTFLIPTGCEGVSDTELQRRIFLDGGKIYFYKTDPDNFSKKIPVEVTQKN